MDIFPEVIRLESSGLCNFRCVHCPTGIRPNGRPNLSMEIFNQFLKNIDERDYIPRVVVLYHGGEPLINKNLDLFIKILKERGVQKTQVVTNGSLLNNEWAERLINARLDEIHFSFDGESPEENNLIRKNGNFLRDAENVKLLISVKKRLGVENPKIKISNIRFANEGQLMEMHRINEYIFNDIPEYIKTFFFENSKDIVFQSYPAMVWPGLETNLYKILEFKNNQLDYCPYLFETITILSNGKVVPCCYDLKGEKVFGNIQNSNILDIWQSQDYSLFRENFRKKIFDNLCKNCNVVKPRFLIRAD